MHVVHDEEPGGHEGTQLLLERGHIAGAAAIIPEPSELHVFRAQKGNLFAAVEVSGRSAHGSMPENGDNAISRAARLITDLEERLAPQLAQRRHSLVGAATLSIGTINGGRRMNVVPDRCTFTIDRRIVPGESLCDAKAQLEAFIGERAEVTHEHAGGALDAPEDHWLVQSAVATATRSMEPCRSADWWVPRTLATTSSAPASRRSSSAQQHGSSSRFRRAPSRSSRSVEAWRSIADSPQRCSMRSLENDRQALDFQVFKLYGALASCRFEAFASRGG